MENRTYRFFKGEPLFPFGYGLSYTTFELTNHQLTMNHEGGYTVKVDVKNTGKCKGTEVVQVYLRRPSDTADGPIKTLRGYARTSELEAGQTETVSIDLPRKAFEWWDAERSVMRILPGQFDVLIGTSSADKDLVQLEVRIL
jgi:beta-glucosidase